MAMEKTFDAASAEARISARWEDENAFRAGANAKPGAESSGRVRAVLTPRKKEEAGK